MCYVLNIRVTQIIPNDKIELSQFQRKAFYKNPDKHWKYSECFTKALHPPNSVPFYSNLSYFTVRWMDQKLFKLLRSNGVEGQKTTPHVTFWGLYLAIPQFESHFFIVEKSWIAFSIHFHITPGSPVSKKGQINICWLTSDHI